MNADTVPYFCWDRSWSVNEIKCRLNSATPDEWNRLAAWIMREARLSDVWSFLSPRQVFNRFAEVKPYLHQSADFWTYILGTWHELGKV